MTKCVSLRSRRSLSPPSFAHTDVVAFPPHLASKVRIPERCSEQVAPPPTRKHKDPLNLAFYVLVSIWGGVHGVQLRGAGFLGIGDSRVQRTEAERLVDVMYASVCAMLRP